MDEKNMKLKPKNVTTDWKLRGTATVEFVFNENYMHHSLNCHKKLVDLVEAVNAARKEGHPISINAEDIKDILTNYKGI